MHAQLILILHAFVKKVVPIYQSRDGTEGLKNVIELHCNLKHLLHIRVSNILEES